MADKQQKSIFFRRRQKYTDGHDEYTFQMKRRRRPWWLLLLLLPLLLFIRCEKDITVVCLDAQTNEPVVGIDVTLDYDAYWLVDSTGILPSAHIQKTQVTDEKGETVFRDLPCSVFSYVFHPTSEAIVYAKNDCFAGNDTCLFHFTRTVELKLKPRIENLHVKLVDLETGDALPDGWVTYQYGDEGKVKTDSAKTDAAGVATLPNMRYCSIVELLKGSCYGYADTTKAKVPAQDLLFVNDTSTLRLRPNKERFTFFVKNKVSKQPIPDALCTVTLTRPGASKGFTRQVRTSIDGRGIAVYDSAFVLATIAIRASKVNYRDSVLTGGPWNVEQFIKQDSLTRTIWLTPEPFAEEFINVDSINGKPIPGVKNVIKITNPDGTSQPPLTEISNSNGVFPVRAIEDAKVEIISTADPVYEPKKTIIPIFKNVKDKKIRMKPVMENLLFRTVREEKPNVLLPDCSLKVVGSISGILSPSNSGKGEFTVTMRVNEKLSIVASKKGYTTNSTKVQNNTLNELKVSQDRRDIPLKLDLQCNGGKNVPKQSNEMHHKRSYGMGKEEGDSYISGDFYGVPDFITVYDGPDTSSPVLIGPKKEVTDKFNIPFHFTKGIITVVIETSGDGSSWEYEVSCPPGS